MTFSRRSLYLFLTGLVFILVNLACGGSMGAPLASPPVEAGEASQPTLLPPAAPEATQQIVVAPSLVALTPTSSVSELPFIENPPAPAIPEARRLTLEYPPEIRLGDTDVIRLTLEVDELGDVTPTAVIEGNVVTGTTVEIPNLYETHKVTAEARLDLAGPIITPSALISEPLSPGQSVTFYWSVRPQEAGNYRGTIWLLLRFVDKQNGEESQLAVSAQQVQIEATTFFGLKAGTARAAGGLGSIIGGILGFPFVDDIFKYLLRRLKGGK